MATLTTADIKMVDELANLGKDELANEDSFLLFDKDMNCHKKFKVSALRALMQENERESVGAARSAVESAKLAESWARGETGTRDGEDTDNAKYYADTAGESASNAVKSETKASAYEASARELASSASISETKAGVSEANAAQSEANAAQSEANAAESASDSADSSVLSRSWAVGGTATREGEDKNNSKYYAEQSSLSASKSLGSEHNAGQSATEARSWAVGGTGTRDGEDEDNSEYYAGLAKDSENSARESAQSAKESLMGVRAFDRDAVLVITVSGEKMVFKNRPSDEKAVRIKKETLFIFYDGELPDMPDTPDVRVRPYVDGETLYVEEGIVDGETLTLGGKVGASMGVLYVNYDGVIPEEPEPVIPLVSDETLNVDVCDIGGSVSGETLVLRDARAHGETVYIRYEGEIPTDPVLEPPYVESETLYFDDGVVDGEVLSAGETARASRTTMYIKYDGEIPEMERIRKASVVRGGALYLSEKSDTISVDGDEMLFTGGNLMKYIGTETMEVAE